MRLILVSLLLGSPLLGKGPVFQEKRGVVAIEAESTGSSLRDWVQKTDVKDFSGTCHLEFTGNSITNGPPKSPLKYRFQVTKPGKYQLAIRARKRLTTKREDLSNDCYVELKGDFESGGGAPKKVLRSPTKMFGGAPDKWAWTELLDFDHQKKPAIYELKAGEVYQLTISGRSKNFNFDRFLLIHESRDFRETCQANPKESATGASTDRRKPQKEKLTTRKLTNRKGKAVTAQLVALVGNTLMVKIKGKGFELKLDELSEDDQDFIKEWAATQE